MFNHDSRYECSVVCVFVCRGVLSLEVDVHAGTSKAKRVSDSDMGGFAWADKRGAVVFEAKEFTASTFHLHRWARLRVSVCPDMRKYCVYCELFSKKVCMCVTEVSHNNNPGEAQINQSGGAFTLETVLTVAQKHTSEHALISYRADMTANGVKRRVTLVLNTSLLPWGSGSMRKPGSLWHNEIHLQLKLKTN